MSLRVVPGGRPSAAGDDGPRILASGAPPSPGPVPKSLAVHLEFGEALLWWGTKDRVERGPLLLVAAVIVAILGFASWWSPEFWALPWSSLWGPLAVLAAPVLLVLWRERANQCAILVTDARIVEVDRDGSPHFVALDGIRAVRRDLLRGGLVLAGARDEVRVPPTLLDDTRSAIASQNRGRIRAATEVDDPQRWLP
jgi:hypothetical protein